MQFISNVNPKHLTGGVWKSHSLKQTGRASRTTSSKAKIYYAHPPATGWVGGEPSLNGWKPGNRK